MNGTEWDVDEVAKVTDGDTVRLVRSRITNIDGHEYLIADANPAGISIRLVWVDTPERRKPGWDDARDDLRDWIDTHRPLRVICYDSAGWDRLLGDLIDADGNSASQWLMAERDWPAYVRGA